MRAQLNVVQGRGVPRTIELEAPSLDAARQQAIALGYAVLSCRSAGLRTWALRSLKSERLDLGVFVEQLRDLLVAGLSVIEALEALRRGAKGATLQSIERLERQLREGKTLSDAMTADATSFPPLLVALVRASELTSDLPQALTRFLEHEQRVTEVRHRLVSTSIYPVLLMGVGALVLLFLLFYVMPRFARVFEGMSGELPWSARAMVGWAQLLRANTGLWLGAMLVGALAIASLCASGAVRSALLQRLLSWAPLQERLNTYLLSRWYRASGMLVQGGIALPQALRLASGVLPAALQAGGQAVQRGVHDGLSPSVAYARAGMATPVAEQLLLAGERTGDLGGVLTRIAQFHESEVSRTLERAMRALEPIVMVLVGLGVGVVVVLMYLPIFELAAAIQ